ncbi:MULTISPECIES: hypothetical protein [unclassified Streptomyces]|uniref:hypothetical protein n=1 Tax=unclassified Streptomyces TaxID=2593676 RepID=UPI002E2E7B72|nr:hypothetical protein [Streptomyces sp. NBC_00223]
MGAGGEYGATGSNVMAHLALVVGDGTTWLEPVTGEEHGAVLADLRVWGARAGL